MVQREEKLEKKEESRKLKKIFRKWMVENQYQICNRNFEKVKDHNTICHW